MSDCRLYLISPPHLSPANFVIPLREALDGGDVASFQLRLKHVDDDAIRRATDLLRPIVQAAGTAFILNDRPDLAKELGCDGVHIGQEDASYAEARAAMGPHGIVGVTAHDSRHLAMEAAEAGADYVAFGAFYPTTTKEVHHHPDPSILGWWTTLFELPCVAIGGITPANAAPLIEAGADFLAVCNAIWNAPEGEAAAVQAFAAVLAKTA